MKFRIFTSICLTLMLSIIATNAYGITLDLAVNNDQAGMLKEEKKCRCKDGTRSLAGGLNSAIPYIISPRSTSILNDKPILRWNNVPDATGYTVNVVKFGDEEKQLWWETEVKDSQVVYNGKPLESGVNYLLTIKVKNGTSSEDENLPKLSLFFRLLNIEDTNHVSNIVKLLDQQQLNADVKAILLAHVYILYDLNAEAISILENAAQGSKNLEIYQLLGDTYDQVGLNRLAESAYLKAGELAAKNTIDLATIQAKLAEVYTTRNDRPKAIKFFNQAIAIYESLGNKQRIMALKQRIKELER